MTTWSSFVASEPELGQRAHAVLTSTTNCVLGTVRADGTPRLSGIDPFVKDGDLYLGCMPDSRKGADLLRDPRFALHSIPWESRKVRDGAEAIDADVKVAGTARRLDAEDARRLIADQFAESGYDDHEPEGDVFALEVASVALISVADDLLVIDRWTPSGGRVTVRRS